MIRTMVIKKGHHDIVQDLPLESLSKNDKWYWVDFSGPTEEEAKQLSRFFRFHPLAIEDCMQRLHRPKVDFYDGYSFFVLHALHPQTFEACELDVFVGENFVVTFHFDP